MRLSITLRHLLHFLVVAEEQNIHRAAERIPTDPSSLSRTIHELEARLGVDLFVRDTHGARLTPAGKQLQSRGEELLGDFEQAVREVQAVHAEKRLPLRIGIAEGLAQPLLTQRLAQWRVGEPNIEFEILELRASLLPAALRREEIDVGFCCGVFDDEAIEQEAVWAYPLIVLVPSGHELSHCSRLTMADVVRQPLVMSDPHCTPGVSHQIELLMKSYADEVHVSDRAASLAGLIVRVGSGAGIALADAGHMKTLIRPDIAMVPLTDEHARLTTFAVFRRRRNGSASETVSRFVAHMKAVPV